MKIEVPLEALCRMGCSDKCYIRRECPQNPKILAQKKFELKFEVSADEKGISLVSTSESKQINYDSGVPTVENKVLDKKSLEIIAEKVEGVKKKQKLQLKKIDDEYNKFKQPKQYPYPQHYIDKMSVAGTGSLYRKVHFKICGEKHEFKARVKWKRHPQGDGLPLPKSPEWVLDTFEER